MNTEIAKCHKINEKKFLNLKVIKKNAYF